MLVSALHAVRGREREADRVGWERVRKERERQVVPLSISRQSLW